MGKGYICSIHEKEEATQVVFLNGVLLIVGASLYVQPWYKTFSPEFVSTQTSSMDGIPCILELFQTRIGKIVQPFNQLFLGDKCGSHTSWPDAPVCVEVDISRQLPSKIHLLFNGSTHIQKAIYLNVVIKINT